MQSGEAQLHLRLDRLDPGDLQVCRGVDRVVQQSGLADPGFPAQDQDTTQALAGCGKDAIHLIALIAATEQRHERHFTRSW